MSSNNSTNSSSGELATLKMGDLLLALPLSEIQSLDPVLDIVFEDARSPSIGYIELNDEPLPVFALDNNLVPLSKPPESHRICAMLGENFPWLGLVCDAVTTLNVGNFEESAVPDCMQTDGSPIRNLMLHKNKVVCATCVDELVRYLELPEFREATGVEAVDVDLK